LKVNVPSFKFDKAHEFNKMYEDAFEEFKPNEREHNDKS
jgi:hypothetical protein